MSPQAGCARRAADKIGGATVSGLSTLSPGAAAPAAKFHENPIARSGAASGQASGLPKAGCTRRAADKIGGATVSGLSTLRSEGTQNGQVPGGALAARG